MPVWSSVESYAAKRMGATSQPTVWVGLTSFGLRERSQTKKYTQALAGLARLLERRPADSGPGFGSR